MTCAMTWLGAGIVVFFGVHLLPSCRLLREKLIGAIGELPYKGVFAVLSLGGLALIIKGMSEAPYIAVWEPPPSAKMATAIFMVPALVLLVAANFNTNIKRIVRHPMSLGVLLWSLSHLLANGDLAALFLFGGFALFSLYDMRSANQPNRPAAAAATDSIKTGSIKMDLLAGVIGMTAYFLLVVFHGSLFGVAVF